MWCILDKFSLCHAPFLLFLFNLYFRYKLYSYLQKRPCELLEFSLSTRHLFFLVLVYFSFSRISSALIPLASNFFSTLSASAFFASSAALASAFAFFASRDATSFSAFFRAAFFSFSVFFCSSIAFWMDAISVFSIQRCNSLLLLCNLGCVAFGDIGFWTVLASFGSGHR